MDEKFVKLVRWIARTLSLIPIGILVFDLFLPHMSGGNFINSEQRVNLSLIVLSIIGLAIAWKWEGVGGILSLSALFLLLFSSMIYNGGNINIIGFYALAIIIFPSMLFIITWYCAKLNNEMV